MLREDESAKESGWLCKHMTDASGCRAQNQLEGGIADAMTSADLI